MIDQRFVIVDVEAVEVYRCIRDYIQKYKFPPSLRDIEYDLEFSHGFQIPHASIRRILMRLQFAGLIARQSNIARGIVLLEILDDDKLNYEISTMKFPHN